MRWPPTGAYGPTVPFGGRRAGYGVEPDHAAVLAVPRLAARHAADQTRDDRPAYG
ncbi:hypothetical protein GCM10010269_56570 [Streptomyces humidus]|uniref:Uncharacterized protein n=1 Tax=Streptomyces humidus TaxID=52259 RepID=A0A918FZW2_9ACTN|nr:hypothetical protein GCM10010269_56570 [Streptomyces humidus]